MELNDSIKAYVDSAVSRIAEDKGLEKLSGDLARLQEEFVEFRDTTAERLKQIEKSEEHDVLARISRLEYEIRQVKLRH